MRSKPTFEMLREHQELRVVYPATGARFTISLRDWQGALWAVKVIPDTRRPTDAFNPFVQQHRMLARSCIEDWLERLRLATGRGQQLHHRPRQHGGFGDGEGGKGIADGGKVSPVNTTLN